MGVFSSRRSKHKLMNSHLGIAVGAVVVALTVFITKKILSKPVTASPRSLDMEKETKSETKEVFLTRKRQTAPLAEKIELSHDTRLFRFRLPTADTVLGLPIGKHFKIHCPNAVGSEEGKWNGREDPEAGKEEIHRSYTPTSSDDDLGHFDLVVKVYKSGVVERFPDGGKASQYLDTLKVGDEINLTGPFGLVEYKGKGLLENKRKPIQVKNIGMVAGGTGITPMLQVIHAIMKDPEDRTQVSLLYANQAERDILVRDMLEKLQRENPDRFKLWYTLDRPDSDWKYSTGFINRDMIAEHMPKAGDDTVILMCGPPPMIKFACIPNFESEGHQADRLISF